MILSYRRCRVWPFETGLRFPARAIMGNLLIVHAEIFPSAIKISRTSGEIKDQAQVRTLAEYFAGIDKKGALGDLFTAPKLTDKQRRKIESEEGWILGVRCEEVEDIETHH